MPIFAPECQKYSRQVG